MPRDRYPVKVVALLREVARQMSLRDHGFPFAGVLVLDRGAPWDIRELGRD